MKRIAVACAALVVVAVTTALTAAAGPPAWTSRVPFTNVVASSPTTGGGYPVPPGSRVPLAGTCRPGPFDANHSESWIAVKPGTEDLVGSSKFFFDKYSTFYMFYLGAFQIRAGTPSGNNQIQGYECVSTGTQDMPPSWTDTTDPNVDFDTKGRVYQTMLPFNSFFDKTKLHPDGEIDMSYSDDMGRHWAKGNGGQPLEPSNNASAKQAGHVEDKQWVAVNHIPGSPYQDHVYAAWAVFNGSSSGQGIKVRIAASRDRGTTFDKAVTISPPSEVGPAVTFVYPEIDAAGYVYVAVVSFPPNGSSSTIYVARSTDDARTFTPFVPITTVNIVPGEVLPNTRFRDGITESFAASPTYPGHLYLTYEDWDAVGGQMDVKFTQSTDGGFSWSTRSWSTTTSTLQVPPPTSSSRRLQPERAARWRSPSTTGGRPVPATSVFSRPMSGGRTSASTRRSRPTRTAAQALSWSAETCGSRRSHGIRSSRGSISAASLSTRAQAPEIRARPVAALSATTSGSRSRTRTCTR